MLSLVLLLIGSAVCANEGEEYMIFDKYNLTNDESSLSDKPEFPGQGTFVYDAWSDADAILKVDSKNDYNPAVIKLSCLVKKLNIYSEIISARLHYYEYATSAWQYFSVLDRTGILKTNTLTATYDYDPGRGLSVVWFFRHSSVNKTRWDGEYRCELQNKHGALISNKLVVRDIVYIQDVYFGSERRKGNIYTFHNKIRSNSYPLEISCARSDPQDDEKLPVWAQNSLKSKFQWVMCKKEPDDELITDRCTGEPIDSYFLSTIKLDGTLVLFEQKRKDIDYIAFKCFERKQKLFISFHNSQDKKGIRVQSNESVVLTLPNEKHFTYSVEDGVKNFKMFAKYLSPRHLEWGFPDTLSSFDRQSIETNPFMMTFPVMVPGMAGRYTLSSDKFHTDFTFDVKVIVKPSVDTNQKLVSEQIVMKTEKLNLPLKFKNTDKINFLIDGKPPNERNFKSAIVGQLPSVQYQEWDYVSDDDTHYEELSHVVTFIAHNSISEETVRLNTFVRVLPVPKLSHVLTQRDCLAQNGCPDKKPTNFTCLIRVQPYKNLRTYFAWYKDNNDLSTGEDKNLQVSGNTLTILPHGNDSKVLRSIRKSLVYCGLKIYKGNQEIYKTKHYPDPPVELTIAFLDAPPIANVSTSEMTWITAVVVAIVILLVAVVLIVWFCHRLGGEVYDVKKAEFICGNDPEKERSENKPLVPYCGLPTAPSLSKGDLTGRRSIDDAMMDGDAGTDSSVQYDDDIANQFDDQGSFIDAYKGPSAQSRTLLLPHSHNV